MKLKIASMLVVLSLLLPIPAEPSTLLRVVDGDTVVVQQGKRKIRIRMAQIDAPEMKQAFGPESKAHLEKLLGNTTMIVVSRGKLDLYGRRLAVLSTKECRNVNLSMVRDGYAWNYRNKAGEFAEAQEEAQKELRGLWKQLSPQSPWDYRKNKKKPKLELIGDFGAAMTLS